MKHPVKPRVFHVAADPGEPRWRVTYSIFDEITPRRDHATVTGSFYSWREALGFALRQNERLS